jgi:hypothetical protein
MKYKVEHLIKYVKYEVEHFSGIFCTEVIGYKILNKNILLKLAWFKNVSFKF